MHVYMYIYAHTHKSYLFMLISIVGLGFVGGSAIKILPTNAGKARGMGSVPGSGRSPGEGNGNSLLHSCLESCMDRGALWAPVHGLMKSWT